MILTAHQPNFFPWLPFFSKIHSADVCVILENVQYVKHNFQNRFWFDSGWKTLSVKSSHLQTKICEKEYATPTSDWTRIKASIGYTWLSSFDHCFNQSLSMTNFEIITQITNMMNIKSAIVKDRPLIDCDATETLLTYCLEHGATTYLSGPSGKKYLNIDRFSDFGIKVQFQNIDSQAHSRLPILEYLNHAQY